jgi:hypothetical protein
MAHASQVRAMYSFLCGAAPAHVDVFGTKFFPMWHGIQQTT